MEKKITQRLKYIGALLLIVYLIYFIGRGYFHNKSVAHRYADLQKRYATEQIFNRELRVKLEQVHDDTFIELTARDKLGLVKPGEVAYKVVKEE